MDNLQAVFLITLMAFFMSVPMGYLREGAKKFSFMWFFYIHAPIPIIAYERITSGISWSFVPVFLIATVAGQIAGSRYKRHMKS